MTNALSLNRRTALKLFSSTILSTAAISLVGLNPSVADAFVEVSIPKEDFNLFMNFSSFAVSHHELNADVGMSTYRAFLKVNPSFRSDLLALNQSLVASKSIDVEGFSDYLKKSSPQQHKLLLEIIRAWYSGAVGDDYRAITCAFQQALMFGTVKDGIPIPTFVHGRPNWWADAVMPSLSNMPEF